ncbi:MAG: hypothetical protein WBI40_02405 [Methylococcaceae bacterium]
MTFSLPNYVWAATSFSAIDTEGRLLNFGNGNAPDSVTTSAGKLKGAKHKYLNVYRDPATGTVVDAIVTIDDLVNGTLTHVDNPSPNPTAKVSSKISGTTYTALGGSVPQGAIFSPWLQRTNQSAVAYVDFTISFVTGTAQTPVVLKNVYNNSLDIESVEYNAYGGFSSYTVSGDPDPLAHIVATADGTKIRFSSVDCAGDNGLYIKDQSRVQAKFDTITSLKLRLGQFPDGTVPNPDKANGLSVKNGTTTPCTNYSPSVGSVRAYGAIFIKDSFTETSHTPIEVIAPTVNTLITTDTKPTITGTIGGTVSAASPSGSPLSGSDTFSVVVNGATYLTTPASLTSTQAAGRLTVSGTTWSLEFLTPLTINTAASIAYEVTATRNGVLVDQTSNELVVIDTCTGGKAWDSITATCVVPSSVSGKVLLCHSGNGKNYAKILIAASGMNGHETHEFDEAVDANGLCPGEVIDCTSQIGKVANAAGTACILPVAPTVTSTKSTDLIPVPISGGATTSNKILSVTLTKIKDGLGATVSGETASTIGTNLTVTNNVWTVSSGAVAVGTYTITAKDGNNLSGTGTFTVECPTGKTATALSCIALVPTVVGQITADTTPTITGTVGSSALVAGETFTVLVNGVTYTNGDGKLSTSGTTWTLNIAANLTTGTTYPVTATRGGTSTATGNVIVVSNPTVVSQSTSNSKPTITGTVGNAVLNTIGVTNETFTVTVNGTTYSNGVGGLTVTGMNWSLIIPTALPVGTYDVVALRDGKLADLTTGELVIGSPPTVIGQTTADTTPTITGTVGSSALVAGETFTVLVNGVTYTNGDGKLSASGTTWTLNVETALTPGTTYPVTATRGGTSTGTGNVILVSNPTVVSQSTSNSKPTITGTVGNAVLNTIGATNETFTVTVNGTTYSNGGGALTVTGMSWSLIIPTALPVGTYDVVALRDGKLADLTTNEIVISGTQPTVTGLSTNDTTPTIMGTFGTNDLGATEAFTVTVNGVTYTKGDGNLVTLNSSWSLTIPVGKELKNGVYEVDAVRDNLLHDLSSNELTIAIAVPTIETQTLREKLPVVIKGTVGDVALDASETFTVVFNGKTYTKGTDANLVISAMAWTLTIPTTEVIAAGTYEIVATRSGTLVDSTTGELVITPLSPPTVTVQTTFDTTPIIRGTVGSVALDTGELFTVAVNGKTYTNGTDINLVVSGTSWTLTIPTGSEIPGRATAYDVTATRSTTVVDTTSGELTIQPCALPKVVNAAGDQCIDPIPTVNNQTVSTNLTIAPTITGTVGEVALGATETFSITIPTTTPQIYRKGDAGLIINGINWTLTVPTSNALSPATYDIVVARNTTATDKTTGELIVNLVCLTGETALNGVCVRTAFLPTVVSTQTDDTTPVITGTVGASALDGDAFNVTVDGTPYTEGDGNLIVTGTQWQLTIPIANALSTGNHNVVATRDTLEGTGVVTITECTKKVNDAGDCVEFSVVPTVTPSATHNMSELRIVVSGTIGDKELTANDTFNVTITEHGNSSHTLTGALVVTGMTWTFELTSPWSTGTFDVNAVRNGTADTTNSELHIGIEVCQLSGSVDKTIAVKDWDDSQYVLGKCDDATDPMPKPPYPEDPERTPAPRDENCTAAEGGGKRSLVDVEHATVKRAKIVNATTIRGTIESKEMLSDTVILYGEKVSGTMDISNADIVKNVATNVDMTGVTLNNVYVGITGSFDINTGEFTPADTSIDVSGGITNRSGTITTASGIHPTGIVIGGLITSGASVAGERIRGRVVEGLYSKETSMTNLTKGRRVMGTLTGATIKGATTTTARIDGSLKTVVSGGTIEPGASLTVESVFGTVVNAEIVDATLTDANHCFSSGTVGARGQLNWKEVISE